MIPADYADEPMLPRIQMRDSVRLLWPAVRECFDDSCPMRMWMARAWIIVFELLLLCLGAIGILIGMWIRGGVPA